MTGRAQTKPINLALQGGGGHGAFTWGVLDRFLEAGSFRFEAISATSGGAMNAVVMVDALERGGVELARTNLEAFWYQVSQSGAMMDSADEFLRAMERGWLGGGLGHAGLLGAFFNDTPEDAFTPSRPTP